MTGMNVRFNDVICFRSPSPGPARPRRQGDPLHRANRRVEHCKPRWDQCRARSEQTERHKRVQSADRSLAVGNRPQLPTEFAVEPRTRIFTRAQTTHSLSWKGIKSRPARPRFDFLFLFFLHVDNTSVSHPLLLGSLLPSQEIPSSSRTWNLLLTTPHPLNRRIISIVFVLFCVP